MPSRAHRPALLCLLVMAIAVASLAQNNPPNQKRGYKRRFWVRLAPQVGLRGGRAAGLRRARPWERMTSRSCRIKNNLLKFAAKYSGASAGSQAEKGPNALTAMLAD